MIGPAPSAHGGGGATATRVERVAPALVSLVAGLTVLGPGLVPGYLLLRDMVFVPSPPLTPRLLGLGHETPRAVPSDLVVALASQLVPGHVVQKALLVGVFVAAGVGASRLAPRPVWARCAAALVAVWNPYVGERLAMGQWALLVGYAAVPWVVLGTGRVARARSGGVPLALGLVVAGLGGAAAWVLVCLAGVGAVAGVAVSTRDLLGPLRRCVRWVPLAAAVALPWAVPALTRPPGVGSDPAGFEVFAPGSDTPLGVVVSLLSGGGAWNADVVPPGRDSLAGAAGALLLLGWAVAGFVLTRRHRTRTAEPAASDLRAPVLGAGVLGLGVALVSLGAGGLAWMADVPGGGLLRDGARESGTWVLVLAVGASWGMAWLLGTGMPRTARVVVSLLPVAALPGLAWGLGGALGSIWYPQDVLQVARQADGSEGSGALVVLPFEAVRAYGWNDARPSLTPWSRLVARRVVASSDLVVQTPQGVRTVAGEDAYATAVRSALDGPHPAEELAGLGIGLVVVDRPGTAAPEGSTAVTVGSDAGLYRLPEPPGGAPAATSDHDPPVAPVVVGDVVALAAGVVAVALAARSRRRGVEMSDTRPGIG